MPRVFWVREASPCIQSWDYRDPKAFSPKPGVWCGKAPPPVLTGLCSHPVQSTRLSSPRVTLWGARANLGIRDSAEEDQSAFQQGDSEGRERVGSP